MLVNLDHISRFSDSWHGNIYICFGLDDEIYVVESYAEVRQKIENAMNEYTRLFGNQYINFPPINTTTNNWTIP